ncbi:MAG: PorT family protein [Treponema sp.]|nr:PorT family protein [Treponema sp.]
MSINRRNPDKSRLALFGLALAVLFPLALAAQNVPAGENGLDYDGKAVVSILPFAGEEETAKVFNAAVSEAVRRLEKYRARNISVQATLAFDSGIPTDMPPIRELAPGARYALTGGVYPGNHENEDYLQLWLWNMGNSAMIYSDDLVYQHLEEGLEALPGLVEWLFSHIVEVTPEPEPPEDPWPDTRFNAGIRSGVSQRWYTDPDESGPGAHALVYEGGVFASVFLNSLFSIQVEANFSFDHLVYRGITNTATEPGYNPVYANEKHSSYSLAFPILVKANLRSRLFRFAPFAGAYVFIPLGEASYEKNPMGETDSYAWSAPLPLGYAVGIETAVKCGPGLLLADVRYWGDFDSIVMDDPGETSYRRGALSITLGYAFGFINMKK